MLLEGQEPEVAISSRCNYRGILNERKQGKLGKLATRSNPPQLVRIEFGEPQVGIGAKGDLVWRPLGCRERKLGDDPQRRDASHGILLRIGKPHVAIRPGDDLPQLPGASCLREGKLRHCTLRRDTPDLISKSLGKPQVAIRSGDKPYRPAGESPMYGWQRKLGKLAFRGETPDLSGFQFRKPEVAIRSARNGTQGGRGRNWKFGQLPRQGKAPKLVWGILCQPEIAIRSRCQPTDRMVTCQGKRSERQGRRRLIPATSQQEQRPKEESCCHPAQAAEPQRVGGLHHLLLSAGLLTLVSPVGEVRSRRPKRFTVPAGRVRCIHPVSSAGVGPSRHSHAIPPRSCPTQLLPGQRSDES